MSHPPTHDRPDGYRPAPEGGPRLRSDIVDVYIFRCAASKIDFLQLLRAGEPLKDTWHPIMGHVETGETAVQTAIRELQEEVGLTPQDPALRGCWSLEQVHPYYVAAIDCIVLSPRFAVEVAADWSPRLNREHSAARWVSDNSAFTWPGQKAAVDEIRTEIAPPDSAARQALRLRL